MKLMIPALVALATAGVAGAGELYDNGPPTYADGNEMTQWTQAEDFMLDAGYTLGSVKFSMLTFNELINWDGSLDWWIYTDAGGSPGSIYASGSAQNVNPVFDQTVGSWDFYDFTFDFGGGGVAVDANTTYWLALHAAADWSARDDLYWSASAANGSLIGHEDYMNQGNWASNGNQHSFQLYEIPAPGALALLGLAGLAGTRRRR
ncbi:MAG: choice-of-anchor R domain-containing protein [Planctomycetota bacterium]|nr:choice-of-anchor R domain-containing protein [Planctomycetota bacterium]